MSSAERLARRVAVMSIVVSALLATVKISVGLAAGSVALVSDGFESAADFFTSGLVLFGLWVAAKPADRDHPYGHGRFETLTGLAVGAILVVTGTAISVRALEERYEQHVPALYAIWPLIGSIGVKSILAVMKLRLGRRSGSAGLSADAWNDVVDILSGAVALGAIVMSSSFPAADHYGGFIIGAIVIFLGVRVVRETVLQLMDTMPDDKQMSQIRDAAMKVPGVRGVEKCFARKTGLRYHVDLHLEVDPEMTVWMSHELAHAARDAIIAKLPWVQDVLVHVEPYSRMRAL
jgi:cation diffusion facilitator family transporter